MLSKTNREYRFLNIFQKIKLKTARGGGILFTDNEDNSQALVSFKKYIPPPLPYFKVNIYPFPLPHFASIFVAHL
jgi:hypothetical protein